MAAPWHRALVTGASSGIGAALAGLLADGGTDLVLVGRSTDALDEVAARLRVDTGVDVEVLAADLTNADDLATVEERLRSTGPSIDLLVNDAGFGSVGAFVDLPAERLEQEIRLNVLAVARLCSAALGPMRAAGRGTILNLASLASFEPVPWFATYSATKAFVLSLSQSLGEELRGTGVTVTALCPGPVATAFAERAGVLDPVVRWAWSTPEDIAAAGLRGAASGRRVVLPGLGTTAVAALAKVVPAPVTSFVAGRLARRFFGGTIDEAAARNTEHPSGPAPHDRSDEVADEPPRARRTIDRGGTPAEQPAPGGGSPSAGGAGTLA